MKQFGSGLSVGMLIGILVSIISWYNLRKDFVIDDPKIKIVKEDVSETKRKDKYPKLKLETGQVQDGNVRIPQTTFDNLVYCVSSDINATTDLKDNRLLIKVEDACKEAVISVDLSTYSRPKHIVQGGYSFINGLGSIYKIDYIYSFKYFGVGGGLVLNNKSLGVEMIVQVPINL